MKALLDTNVIVDTLQQREPMFVASSKVIIAIATNQLQGYVTSKEIADIHYFSRKQFAGQDEVDKKARQVIEGLLKFLDIIDTTGGDCKKALTIENNDYEDAIMISSAVRSNMDCIITRNRKHFNKSPIPIYSPEELLELLNVKDVDA
ncbi:MAG: PIN domain-containing protein [Selenomonadaceae bacterium]|nr:PIN domain-containing protein [Selenomonadaceae bacterium]